MENTLTKVCIKNDVLGIDLQSINIEHILDPKLRCAIRNAQKANNSLTAAFDALFKPDDQKKLAETADLLDKEFDKIIDSE